MIPKFRAWDGEKMNDDFFIDSSGNCWDYANVVYDTPNLEIFGAPQLKIMQSTGLKDKNGVEIFEGDIVAIKYSESGYHYYEKIVFENGTFTAGDEDWLYNIKDYCVVCGNIYENPELLKGAKQ